MATSNAFKEIAAGLLEFKAGIESGKFAGRVTPGSIQEIDVMKVRAKTGLSQGQFANVFGFSSATLKNWEQKRNTPAGPARVLLTVIDRDPRAVLKALRVGPSAAPRLKTPRLKKAGAAAS